VLLAVFLFLPSSQHVLGDAGPRAPVIVVHVQGAVHVPRWDLEPAIDQTSRAFRAIGIQTVWRSSVAAPVSPAEFTLVFLTPDMAARKCSADQVGPAVLGSSAPAARRAWIFVDRITAVARGAGLPVSDIMGQVVTHELGHLLLSDKVDGAGIMREHVQMTGAASFRFTAAQGERMRGRLREAAKTDTISDSMHALR
jgi:hypothetical protein